MEERIVIPKDKIKVLTSCGHFSANGYFTFEKEDAEVKQVPETFSDLQELCEKINSKLFIVDCGYTTRIIITEIEFRRTITFYDNGLVIVSPDKDYEIILTENRTLRQMWQIIKNLIGEE